MAIVTNKSSRVAAIGDFNAHMKGFASACTNSSGRLLTEVMGAANLKLLSLDKIIFKDRHGMLSCVVYIAMTPVMEKG